MTSTTEKSDVPGKRPQLPHLFVRADEVDAGTSILTPTRHIPLSALSPSPATLTGPGYRAPPRPVLKRDGSLPPPPPPSQPPPNPPTSLELNPTDSLSLPQLRQLVSQFPKTEQRAYAFQYREAEDFETEIDEWFHYTEPTQERDYLLISREVFEQRWKSFCQKQYRSDEVSWSDADLSAHQRFLDPVTQDLTSSVPSLRVEALGCLFHILTGVWSVTSGLEAPQSQQSTETEPSTTRRYHAVQIQWMHKGIDEVIAHPAKILHQLYACLRKALKIPADSTIALEDTRSDGTFDEEEYRELSMCFSCLYIITESARSRRSTKQGNAIRTSIISLQPNLITFLISTTSRLRWDEGYNIPLMHALQLLWKCILVIFGDVYDHLESIKSVLHPRVDPFSSEAAHPVLTASPLDYHNFRQEITSKYPAYNPPLPLVPLELEQKTMLPPLVTRTSRPEASSSSGLPSAGMPASSSSILHQPVHIATPAPSPPPTPIGPGGKAGKKQNYQTNQNFPFLYPPLDSESNNIGGKGTTELQDLMVGKKWEGSDIPASIIEAGELFASRMRMTRAMRQLWRERDRFMKYDRGWRGEEERDPEEADFGSGSSKTNKLEHELESLKNPDLRQRMDLVEDVFHHALPDLQSLVIVMMKVMLTNVQDIAVRSGNMQEPAQPNGPNRNKVNTGLQQNQNLPAPPPPTKPTDMSLEDLDNVRSREVSQKAVSGICFVLCKWFKASHVLKFEYITQLLLDSNYVQLTLKYFAHQNLEELVAFQYDRDDLNFFHYCHIHSDHPPLSPTSGDDPSDHSSADEAVPPPIKRNRPITQTWQSIEPTAASVTSPEQDGAVPVNDPTNPYPRPSVDELGNPLAPLPSTPITDYSFRQFQTSIHLLRVLQKVTRAKSHRVLLLVQFKSSQILRRVLRVPDPMLRLYVLKLFKSQVPYCGRKWRQSNMRVITAIYLHCRPELRDEWLAGMHDTNVEGEVEEAVPLEWALRGLTYWWQKRTYPDVMKVRTDKDGQEGGHEIEDDERDFFQRELDNLGWGLAGLGVGEEVAFGEEAPGVNGMNGEGWEQGGGGGGGGGGGNAGNEMWQ